jgi:hypothetical protein
VVGWRIPAAAIHVCILALNTRKSMHMLLCQVFLFIGLHRDKAAMVMWDHYGF